MAPASTSTAVIPRRCPGRRRSPGRRGRSGRGREARRVGYQANVWLCVGGSHGADHVRASTTTASAVVTMDYPPVNALPVQGWFDLAAALDEAEPRPGHPRRRAPRRGQGLQRRRGHQGDAAHRGVRRADRRQPRLLRRVPGRLRVRGPGDRRGERLLPRRRRRAGRQRRLHRGQRRRLLRHPGGRPRRARRGHPPGPDGAAAPDAHPLLHRPHHRRRRPRPARLGAGGGPARPSSTTPPWPSPARSRARTPG